MEQQTEEQVGLIPILVPTELEQLKWLNLGLSCQALRQKAENLDLQAEQLRLQSDALASQANSLKDEIHKHLANGSGDLYEAVVVEGQLQFQLKQSK